MFDGIIIVQKHFLGFLKKVDILSEKGLFRRFFGVIFGQVQLFCSWGFLIGNISSLCDNLKMCFGIFF